MTTEAVNQEPVSTEEPVSGEAPKAEEPKGEETKPELTEERVQQLIAEATATAVTKAEEAGRRNLQSEQDRNKNAEKRAKLAEGTVKAYESSFNSLDEDTQKDIELGRYREQEKINQSSVQEDARTQQDAQFYQRMNDGVLTNLDNLGIARDDKRIDWGAGSQDYIEARNRLDTSVAKILSTNRKEADEKQGKDFKELETKLRKDLGLDSVDTTTGGGGGSDSDADFKKGIGDGSLPLNKENMKRAKGLGLAR